MGTDYKTLRVIPVSPALGAEISGVDIAAGIDDEQFAELQQAFIDYSVIFLRDQEITPDQHVEFAHRWGEININRFFQAAESHPMIAEVRKEAHQKANIGSSWHTDHSYDQIPAMGSILYAREVPQVGGDTLFASMYAAYDALSDGMKAMLSQMNAVHSSRHAFGEAAYAGVDMNDLGGRLGNTGAATQDAVHPVVIRHPLSGRPALYVNGDFTVRFDGWTREESQPLLDFLYAHACQNEFTCRLHWRKGSMAIWDNRATHHCALNDYHGERRLMHRITLEGVPLQAAA
ncbi:MAG: TauD/TfdA family dioxygenase [Gammaproteobacteria bacterium]|nr:MAG: TauD/TfdA family dioxygenase [Gammaproteobacteria bacterium]UCH40703.1 MAG: TauD/TfdA family dioxygenase [Gammaproteobacteria bacterium]